MPRIPTAVAAALAALTAATGPAFAAGAGEPTRPAPGEPPESAPVVGSAGWSQYRAGAARRASVTWPSQVNGGAPAGRIDWSVPIGSGSMIDASPIVHPENGDIYVGTVADSPLGGRARLFAFTQRGELHWITQLQNYAVRAAPAVRADGRLVVTGSKTVEVSDQRLGRYWDFHERTYLLDPSTGTAIAATGVWGVDPVDIQEPTFRASPVVEPGTNSTYVVTPAALSKYNSALAHWRDFIVLSGATGYFDWPDFGTDFDPSGPVGPPRGPEPPVLDRLPSPAISSQCGDVVWQRGAGAVRARLSTGRGRVVESDVAITTPVLGKAGRMYVVVRDDDGVRYLDAIDQSYERVWRRRLPSGPAIRSAPVAIGRAGATGGSEATCTRIEDGTTARVHAHYPESVYITVGGALQALDDDGRLRWSTGGPHPLGEPVVVRISGDRELIIVPKGGGDPSLVAYRHDGSLAWQIPLDGPAYGSPAVAGGRIYLATTRSLYSIR